MCSCVETTHSHTWLPSVTEYDIAVIPHPEADSAAATGDCNGDEFLCPHPAVFT